MNNQNKQPTVPCLIKAWKISESELYHWLLKQSGDHDLSADLLQETFLKALQQQQKFCDIKNQRAWLYRVAYHLFIDENRKNKYLTDLDKLNPKDEQIQPQEQAAIDTLAQCLPKAMQKLSPQEQQIILQCDLQQCSQQDFAKQHQITLSATKSRIQRARKKLKQILISQCRIQFNEQQKVCCFKPEKKFKK